jgi:hypothetical protein
MKEYVIKKGKHYPEGLHMGLTFKKSIKFKAKFDESCLYDLHSVDNHDINKLFGFSTTWHHHKQSARIGWRCLDGKTIEVLTYTYNDSERDIESDVVLGVVKPNEVFTCEIIDYETNYQYSFHDSQYNYNNIQIEKQSDWFFFHYILYPYFGGNRNAPHDMKIYIEKL